ncbi:MAG: hypothetical protein ACRC7Q_08915 [Plesiomonas shigelloides]
MTKSSGGAWATWLNHRMHVGRNGVSYASPEIQVKHIDTRIAQLEQELNTLHEHRREIINRNNLNK